MSGEIDVYQPCPCGSGKKLKFCCQAIVTEMVKVSELQQSHQNHAALSLLDTLDKKLSPRDAWPRAWVKTTKAFVQFAQGGVDEPRRLVAEVLAELPEHPLAVAINGILSLATDGYPAAMRPVYRAFQLAANGAPFLVSHLALLLSQALMAKGHLLAARQNLALAVKFDPNNQETAEGYLALLGDGRIPYLLRDGYVLLPLQGAEEHRAQFDAAMTLARQGCFSDAAKAFGGVARHDPRQAGLWWNIGLCHAWAGEDPLAVEAFKAAAANEPDFESAVDRLVLSRELRPAEATTRVPQVVAAFSVESAGKLLTALDQKPEYARIDIPESGPDDEELRPAAAYRILDRDPNLVPDANLAPENIAHVLGELVVYDRPAEDVPARAFLSGYGRERVAQLAAALGAAAAPLVTADGEPKDRGFLRAEHAPLVQDWYFPPTLAPAQLHELRRAAARHIIEEVWPGVPQEALGGKTPLAAAQVPELKTALAAAIVSFDAFCEKNNLSLDEDAVRTRLGLPAVMKTALGRGPDAELPTLLRLRHTAVNELMDSQLVRCGEAVTQIGHSTLSATVVAEMLSRPSLADKIDVPGLCMFLSRVYTRRLDHEAALSWIVRGKQESRNRKQPLDAIAIWEIHELMLRAQRPDDPQIAQLANTLWNYYVPKLPEIREVVAGILNELPLAGPWNAGAPVAAAESLAGAAVGSGLWTPEAQTAGQPSKLWLPGQE